MAVSTRGAGGREEADRQAKRQRRRRADRRAGATARRGARAGPPAAPAGPIDTRTPSQRAIDRRTARTGRREARAANRFRLSKAGPAEPRARSIAARAATRGVPPPAPFGTGFAAEGQRQNARRQALAAGVNFQPARSVAPRPAAGRSRAVTGPFKRARSTALSL